MITREIVIRFFAGLQLEIGIITRKNDPFFPTPGYSLIRYSELEALIDESLEETDRDTPPF